MGVRRERWVFLNFTLRLTSNPSIKDDMKKSSVGSLKKKIKRKNHRQFFFFKYIYSVDLGKLKNKKVEFVAAHKVLLDINRG